MAIKINFDSSYNVIPPTLVLATRNSEKLGGLNYYNLVMKDCITECSEMSFKINKNDCVQNKGKTSLSHVKAISITNTIQGVGDYIYFATLTPDDFSQFLGYYKSYQIRNCVLTFTVANTTQHHDVDFSQENDFSPIFIKSRTNEINFVKVEQNGNVYINNTEELSLPLNAACHVQLDFDIIIDLYNDNLWKSITDFKLVWVKDWDRWFEIYVSVDESEATTKNVTTKSLGEAELSQVYLYDVQINTEDDIAREDYVATVLYNPDNKQASLLHRITEKVPHYNIAWVDESIMNTQRTFTFNGKSVYDAFQEIAQEIECVFDIRCHSTPDGKIARDIYVYDINSYGNDTNILLSANTLADSINYSVDNGAVKNCFRLEAGDDLMTATVRNCNPNGSNYIWYISDKLKEDMSDELVNGLENYNNFYNYYQNIYNPLDVDTSGLNEIDVAKVQSNINDTSLINSYNQLIEKYSQYTSAYTPIAAPIVGYAKIMEIYYNTIDFYYYLNNGLMPTINMSETNAQTEGNKLTYRSLYGVAVQNLSSTTSVATVSSAVLAMAKVLVNPNYQVKIVDENATFTYSENESKWKGSFIVTNYSDEEDTFTTMQQTVIISSDYAAFIKQKLDIALSNSKTDTIADIEELFKLNDSNFKNEIKKYSLQKLKAFHDACQGCLDILQQQGIADDRNEENNELTSLYSTIYLPYYNKLAYIQKEMDIRQAEIDIVKGKFDENGGVLQQGIQSILKSEQDLIRDNLNFQQYLGEDLWLEFTAYRREDTYTNSNYISDGLDNAELFNRAIEFINTAKDEIEKSATLQHTINATLKNLLVMKEFQPIVDYFEIGNWLRIKVDDTMYKLRLVNYQIDFEKLENIEITFSDVTVDGSGVASVKNILSQAANMSTTYNAVTRQARRGNTSAGIIDDWVNQGLKLTTTKIADKADNQEVTWDKHGLMCREYNDILDSYSDEQLKLINKGLYITDNNWRTAKVGVGKFTFFNPEANNGEGEWQDSYGVIADTLVGNLILGKNVGIYNTKNSIAMNDNGFVLTTNNVYQDEPQPVFTIRRKSVSDGNSTFDNMFYIDSNGYVTINGGVKIDTGSGNNSTMVEMVDNKITTHITDELDNGGLIESSISQTASEIKSTVAEAVNKYDETGYAISLRDYGTPNATTYLPSDYTNQLYLDQENGYVYKSDGSVWNRHKDNGNQDVALSLIITKLQTQITQNTNSISSKVSAGDVHTIIQQTPEDVRIAWNGISNYIAFENSAIKIKNSNNSLLMQLNNSGMNLYDNNAAILMNLNSDGLSLYESDGNSGNRLTMRLNRSGAGYYNEGNYLGRIGTNRMAGDSTIRGLTFNLESVPEGETARYMSWGYLDGNNGNAYTVKMAYYTNNFEYTYNNVTQNFNQGFYFSDDVYFRKPVYLINGASVQSNSYNGINIQCNNMVQIEGNGGEITLNNSCIFLQPASGGYIGASGDLHMNNYIIYDTNVTSSSDARLKKNISLSQIKGLAALNSIEISAFDWIATDKHVDAGLIAQQLQSIIPDAVLENPSTNRLSIKTDTLIPYIIKAIQELTHCIENDDKCKANLQLLDAEILKRKSKWVDNTNIKQKTKFLLETKPVIPNDVKIDKNPYKVFLPG